ncbi:cyclic nucleotide-binding domain-containing protein 2-like [Ambystoma mexicanum]|uniref:cyclic nucleotide-binding domain-containing protein 2-like n=1 Tax=Ambystoma mexicanum TaxID=8296 RepID=UPI0037E81597
MPLSEMRGGRSRFRKVAHNVRFICGMLLAMKRYIGKSPVVEWAAFHLQMQSRSKADLLFNLGNFAKNNLRKDFAKLKSLLHTRPNKRSQQELRQIQMCLKKNRAFQNLPERIQLHLCQVVVYQEYEAKTMIIKQGHVPSECYLILSGNLKVTYEDGNSKNRLLTEEMLNEVEEGDFLGEICLLTNRQRPVSVSCNSDVEVLVISKEDLDHILGNRLQEQYTGLWDFLRKAPVFASWPSDKIEFLIHCCLQRYHRAGTTVVLESISSPFLVLVKSGRCMIATRITQERRSTCSSGVKNYSTLLKNFPTIPFIMEKAQYTHTAFERPALFPRSAHSAVPNCSPNLMSRKTRPQTAAPLRCSLGEKKDLISRAYAGEVEEESRVKRSARHQKITSPPPQFITVGVLEQGGIFGLAETMGEHCGLQFSLISEGAECVFIPRKLFLTEATATSKRVAQQLVNNRPTESMIRESYMKQQAWISYKARLVGQQLQARTRPISAHSFFEG